MQLLFCANNLTLYSIVFQLTKSQYKDIKGKQLFSRQECNLKLSIKTTTILRNAIFTVSVHMKLLCLGCLLDALHCHSVSNTIWQLRLQKLNKERCTNINKYVCLIILIIIIKLNNQKTFFCFTYLFNKVSNGCIADVSKGSEPYL